MQITGQILNVAPRMNNGYPETFTTENGTFYVFEMSIQQPQGPIVGQINAKSPQYPLQNGEQIIVEQSNDAHGVRFKKINPRYQQQQPQQQQPPPQQSYQQQAPPQQRPQQQAPPPRDYDKENMGKCRFGCYKAAIESGVKAVDLANDRAELEAMEILSKYSVYGLPQQQQAPPPQQDYSQEPPFTPTDDIPF